MLQNITNCSFLINWHTEKGAFSKRWYLNYWKIWGKRLGPYKATSKATNGGNYTYIFCFLGPHPWHMEVSRLGVQSELQLPAYTTATTMWDLSCVCDLHHSSRQWWILNLLSEARDLTCVLMDTCQVCYCLATTGTPESTISFFLFFVFLGPHLQHVEVPRLGLYSELRLLASTTATAARDP